MAGRTKAHRYGLADIREEARAARFERVFAKGSGLGERSYHAERKRSTAIRHKRSRRRGR